MAAQRSETKKEKIEIWVRSRKSPLFTLQLYKSDFVQLFTLFKMSTFINVNYYNMKKLVLSFVPHFAFGWGFQTGVAVDGGPVGAARSSGGWWQCFGVGAGTCRLAVRFLPAC